MSDKKRVEIPAEYAGQVLDFKVVGIPTEKLRDKGLVLLQAFGTKLAFNIVVNKDQIPVSQYGNYVHAMINPLPPREGMPTTWAVSEILGFTPKETFLNSHGKFAQLGNFLDTEEGKSAYLANAKRRFTAEILDLTAKRQLETELAAFAALDALEGIEEAEEVGAEFSEDPTK